MNKKSQPDIISSSKALYQSALDWVGMNQVELPVIIANKTAGIQSLPARCDLLISLDDPEMKGIHMSRLYIEAQEFLSNRQLNFMNLIELTQRMINSHSDVSSSACVNVDFEYMVKQPALKTDQFGWRFYPIQFSVVNSSQQLLTKFTFEIHYSSTCPCSAALSRQIVQEEFLSDHQTKEVLTKEEVVAWLNSSRSQAAVPHAQRSTARIEIQLEEFTGFTIDEWISKCEAALGTSVQSLVKREDEQEFARLNGSNMMFSEDAARKLVECLDNDENVIDYTIQVEHHESLHPHNAVVITSKNR